MTRHAMILLASLLATRCGDTLPTRPSPPVIAPQPASVPGKSTALVTVEDFTVTSAPVRFSSGVRISYIPRIRLKVGSGSPGILVTSIDFHLEDIGATGNVPPWPFRKRVEPGTTRDLIEDFYGEPEFEMDSSAQTSRVSVAITFLDDEQHLASVNATSEVTISQ
jgi:hypothetical protein